MVKRYKEKGITLIALVVTIIVLLILAAVSLAMLTGENGIIYNAKLASENTKIENYSEEIKILINDEILERSYQNKEEPFIKTLKNKIEQVNWRTYILMVNDTGEESEDFEKSNQLIIGTIDNYELIVEVDNDRLRAEIVSKGKAENTKYEISYWEEGKEKEKVQIRSGFSIRLKECSISIGGYSFIGWCSNEDGEGDIYPAETLYKPSENVTLYAIFEKIVHFDANGGTGNLEDVAIIYGKSVILSQSSNITKPGFTFKEWNSKADGSGISYSDSTSILIDDEVTKLYAIWFWDNNNWEVFWKQSNIGNGKVINGNYEISAPSNNNCWCEVGTKNMFNLKDVKQIKITMDFDHYSHLIPKLGIIPYKDTEITSTDSGFVRYVNIDEGNNQTVTLNVSDITDSTEYYIVMRIAPAVCRIKNLEFIY